MPRKVRQLIADVEKAGMEYQPRRGKGSHRVYKHEASGTEVTISGHTGADAQPYQERDVREAIKKIRQVEQGEG